MPSLTFVLPHWLYWSGLVLFPFAAMLLVRRAERHPTEGRVSLPIGYLLLVTGGFLGLHRFYARLWTGVIYLAAFAAILYGNVQVRDLRNGISKVRYDLVAADFMVERAQSAVQAGEAGAAEKLAAAQQQAAAIRESLATLTERHDQWDLVVLALLIAVGLGLLYDAVRLPSLLRRTAAREREEEPPPPTITTAGAVDREFAPTIGQRSVITAGSRNPLIRAIDAVSRFSGNFVCYWSVLAVFVYYYEVIARYLFNSPTNWAHESMFLMFGMQYLLAGAYAYREDAHVRVDVLYSMFSLRTRALLDMLTSVFFFIFTGALLWTGWTFMMDSMAVWEVSFTEWAIQYWPVKASMVVGTALIILQGLARLMMDIRILRGHVE